MHTDTILLAGARLHSVPLTYPTTSINTIYLMSTYSPLAKGVGGIGLGQ